MSWMLSLLDTAVRTVYKSLTGGETEAGETESRETEPRLGDNQWVKPVFEVGPNEGGLETDLKWSQHVGDVNFTRKDWGASRNVVDSVLDMVLEKMKDIASRRFQGLKLEKYIRKGSSREGLKTGAPDEYDTLLQYHLEGLNFEHTFYKSGESHVIQFGEIRVFNSSQDVARRFPQLNRDGAFVERYDGQVFLSSEVLYEVLKSLVDSARDAVVSDTSKKEQHTVPFRITRKVNAAAINITIKEAQGSSVPEIDVDIVPGLRVTTDSIQHVSYSSHFIFRWQTKEQKESETQLANPGQVWRFSNTGFEAYVFDTVRAKASNSGRYLMTAMRILKTYFSTSKATLQPPPPISTVLVSYHLKHIVLYCIQYIDIGMGRDIQNVKQAMGFILDLLEVSLEEKKLPHYFRRNEMLQGTFPDYTWDTRSLAFDVFGKKSTEALEQAQRSLSRDLRSHLSAFITLYPDGQNAKVWFRQFIRDRKYFKSGPTEYGFKQYLQ